MQSTIKQNKVCPYIICAWDLFSKSFVLSVLHTWSFLIPCLSVHQISFIVQLHFSFIYKNFLVLEFLVSSFLHFYTSAELSYILLIIRILSSLWLCIIIIFYSRILVIKGLFISRFFVCQIILKCIPNIINILL